MKKSIFTIRAFNDKLSLFYEKKAFYIIIISLVLLFVSIIISLSVGESFINPIKTVQILFGGGSKFEALVVNKFRMPRTISAFLVGAGLGVSGAIIQSILKNPLASPSILGITYAGATGILLFLTIFFDEEKTLLEIRINYLPIASFLASLIALLLIYLFALNKEYSSFRLILIGLAVGGIFKGAIDVLLINGPMIFMVEFQSWLNGTLYGVNKQDLWILFAWILPLIIITILLSKEINVLNLSDEQSVSLGVKLDKNRLILLTLATFLAAICVSVAGVISFVGLIVPNVVKRLASSSCGNVIPLSVLLGGSLVVIADTLARVVMFPIETPVGILTSIAGALFFIVLIFRSK